MKSIISQKLVRAGACIFRKRIIVLLCEKKKKWGNLIYILILLFIYLIN